MRKGLGNIFLLYCYCDRRLCISRSGILLSSSVSFSGFKCCITVKWSNFFFFLSIFLAFLALFDSTAEEIDRKQGKRRGVTRSKGTRAGSRTRVRCRASAHGSRTLPTELCGARDRIFWTYLLYLFQNLYMIYNHNIVMLFQGHIARP